MADIADQYGFKASRVTQGGAPTRWTKYTATLHGLTCVVSPIIRNGVDTETWTAAMEGFTIVTATDDLEHAFRRCVAFAKEAAGAI